VLGDRVVDVNGAPVSDKEVARTMLLKSLQKYHTVSLLIERAESQEAKDVVMNALHASEMQPPSGKFVVTQNKWYTLQI
jgi:C-terminal processing protease CtpA/Prc